MNLTQATKVLEQALHSDNYNVIVLKGAWGIGKTYLWHSIVNKNKSVNNLKKYGYISLFGKDNLKEINEAALSSIYFSNKVKNLHNKFRKVFQPVLRITEIFNALNLAMHGIDALLSVMGKENLSDVTVCFDDLERMNKNINFQDFMGYISNLAECHKCKVVLIFNQEELFRINDNIQSVYQTYKEKVIDLEIEYQPTSEDTFTIAAQYTQFADNAEYLKNIQEVVCNVEENNIRVIRKSIETVDRFIKAFRNCEDFCIQKDEYANIFKIIDNNILEFIQSVTYISICYWKIGIEIFNQEKQNQFALHNALLSQKDLSEIELKLAKGISHLLNGKYIDLIKADLCQAIPYPEKEDFIKYFKSIAEELKYNDIKKQLTSCYIAFSRNKEGRIDEYKKNILHILKHENNANIYFTYVDIYELNDTINDIIDICGEEFLYEFKKLAEPVIDNYITIYQSSYDEKIDSNMQKKISIMFPDKSKELYKKLDNNNIDTYYIRIIYEIMDVFGGKNEYIDILNNISYNEYYNLCNMQSKQYNDTNFFFVSMRLFFDRKNKQLENKLYKFFKIVANDLRESIEDNPDNIIKYNHLRKNFKNKPYDIIKDLDDFFNEYK